MRKHVRVSTVGRPLARSSKSSGLLTDDFLEKMLAFPRYTTYLYLDTETAGLQCRIGRHRATWIFYHDDRRHQRRKYISKRLGFFPGISTAELATPRASGAARSPPMTSGRVKREAVKVETSLAEYVAHLERRSTAKGKPATWAKLVRQHRQKAHRCHGSGQWSSADIAVHPGAVRTGIATSPIDNGPVVATSAAKILRAAYRRSASAM